VRARRVALTSSWENGYELKRILKIKGF